MCIRDSFDTVSSPERFSQQAEKIDLRVWVRYEIIPAHNISSDELVAQLQALVKEKLPDYMLPSAFVLLEALPMTPNGKLDRRALPAPKQTHPALQSTFVRARTPIEETIVAIWSQVLGIEQVGIHDNFFALGGHSLRAMQVLSRLRAIFQVEVPLHSFLEAPTVSQLAELLQQHQASGTKSHMPSLRPISREAYRVPSLRQPKVLMNEQE